MWSGYFRTIVDVGFKPGAIDPLVIGCRQAGCDVIEILSRLGTMILAILLSIFSVYFSGRYECTRVIDGDGAGLYRYHSGDRLYRGRYRKGVLNPVNRTS
jgi:hypothetical protein